MDVQVSTRTERVACGDEQLAATHRQHAGRYRVNRADVGFAANQGQRQIGVGQRPAVIVASNQVILIEIDPGQCSSIGNRNSHGIGCLIFQIQSDDIARGH